MVQRILLGADLRDIREAAGLSNAEASKALGWYTGKLSKVEQDDMKVNDKDLEKAVRVYKIPDNRATSVRRSSRDSAAYVMSLSVRSGEGLLHYARGATEGNFSPKIAFSGTSARIHTPSVGQEGLMRRE